MCLYGRCNGASLLAVDIRSMHAKKWTQTVSILQPSFCMKANNINTSYPQNSADKQDRTALF